MIFFSLRSHRKSSQPPAPECKAAKPDIWIWWRHPIKKWQIHRRQIQGPRGPRVVMDFNILFGHMIYACDMNGRQGMQELNFFPIHQCTECCFCTSCPLSIGSFPYKIVPCAGSTSQHVTSMEAAFDLPPTSTCCCRMMSGHSAAMDTNKQHLGMANSSCCLTYS